MLTNAQVATALSELATLMDLTGEDGFRVNAHARAARTLEGLSEEVCGVAPDRARLTAIPGIGAKLADKIVEICTTGVLTELDTLRAKVPAGLMDILQVPGLGPKTSYTRGLMSPRPCRHKCRPGCSKRWLWPSLIFRGRFSSIWENRRWFVCWIAWSSR